MHFVSQPSNATRVVLAFDDSRLLYLKAYSVHTLEFLGGQIDNEPRAQILESMLQSQ